MDADARGVAWSRSRGACGTDGCGLGVDVLIRCFGARGSIPVSGPQYVTYGGDTTCLEIRGQSQVPVIVDAGSGIRRLGNRLLVEGESRFSMIFTHSHWDHILGFPFFKPIYAESTHIDLYGCPMSQGDMRHLLTRTMSAPYFPVPFSALKAEIDYQGVCRQPTLVEGIEVSSIPLSHPNLGLGYRFEENGVALVFLTDNELFHPHPGGRTFEDYAAFAADADLLIHDAEYTDADYERTRGWGHSVYTQALDLALAANVKRFGLFHHNQERADEEVDAMVADCRRIAAERGRADMDIFALSQESEITL